mmetsp:Transcript_8712/g.24020  ORF Transcript_8712/g.24020 Transcript_8712/m.24020 type:complete len:267 (+) Transcript_8712:106-906(+)
MTCLNRTGDARLIAFTLLNALAARALASPGLSRGGRDNTVVRYTCQRRELSADPSDEDRPGSSHSRQPWERAGRGEGRRRCGARAVATRQRRERRLGLLPAWGQRGAAGAPRVARRLRGNTEAHRRRKDWHGEGCGCAPFAVERFAFVATSSPCERGLIVVQARFHGATRRSKGVPQHGSPVLASLNSGGCSRLGECVLHVQRVPPVLIQLRDHWQRSMGTPAILSAAHSTACREPRQGASSQRTRGVRYTRRGPRTLTRHCCRTC